TGMVNALAPNGVNGQILLDPADVVVVNGARANAGNNFFVGVLNSALGGGNVTVLADNSITFQNTANITNAGNGNSLTFQVLTTGGGINTDDTVVGHGSISITGGSATLSFLAGPGGIDLYDAPTQGGTNFI